MPVAVGTIETLGFPAILAAADAAVKAARVTLVKFDMAEKGNFYITVRGPVSEVQQSIAEGITAAQSVFGGEVMSHYIIANPTENVQAVMPMDYSERTEPYRV